MLCPRSLLHIPWPSSPGHVFPPDSWACNFLGLSLNLIISLSHHHLYQKSLSFYLLLCTSEQVISLVTAPIPTNAVKDETPIATSTQQQKEETTAKEKEITAPIPTNAVKDETPIATTTQQQKEVTTAKEKVVPQKRANLPTKTIVKDETPIATVTQQEKEPTTAKEKVVAQKRATLPAKLINLHSYKPKKTYKTNPVLFLGELKVPVWVDTWTIMATNPVVKVEESDLFKHIPPSEENDWTAQVQNKCTVTLTLRDGERKTQTKTFVENVVWLF